MTSSSKYYSAKLIMLFVFSFLAIKTGLASPCNNTPAMLESDKPNLIGLAKDSGDDHSYLDINISLDTPIAYGYLTKNKQDNCVLSGTWLPYFGVNLAAAFYAVPSDKRPSSPVVGKAFNPFFRVRLFTDESNIGSKDAFEVQYIDLEYGHLSNGQQITTLAEFKATSVAQNSTLYAQDYISRGWDYFGTNIHRYYGKENDETLYHAVTINLRKYIGGFFQQTIEEYNPLIEPSRTITALNQVSGIRVSDKIGMGNSPISSISLTLDTGLDAPFERNSIRIDTELFSEYFQPKVTGFSLDLWARSGYAANLAHYYDRIDSVGIAFLFETFNGTLTPSAPAAAPRTDQ